MGIPFDYASRSWRHLTRFCLVRNAHGVRLSLQVDVVDNMFNDLILLAKWAVRLHCFIVSHRFTILSLSVGLLLYRWLLLSSLSSSSPTATYYSSLHHMPLLFVTFTRSIIIVITL